jgi:nitric oxide reductase subunit C
MTGKTARLIFWLGTLSSAAIFLWMTYDFHRQTPRFTRVDQLTGEVVQGKRVWHKYNCNDCHTILGFGGYYAPDMTKAYYRLGENNIVSIVRHPETVYRNSFRKMPQLGVTDPEARRLVIFLKWVGTIDNRHWPPQDEKFVKAYQERQARVAQPNKVDVALGACGGCHSFQNQGRNLFGDFSDLARRIPYDRETLIRYILNPQSIRSGIAMPPQNVSRETAALIADFILSLRPEKEVRR